MVVPVPDQLEYISNADGVTKDFPYPTRFLQKDEIVVVLRDADGIDTPQYLNQHFTIAGSSWPNGGLVSFYNAPPHGMKVIRSRQTQAKQTVDLGNKQRNDAEAVELQLDRLTMAIQDRGARTDAAWWGVIAEISARIHGDRLLNARVDQEIIDRDNGDKALASLIGQAGSIAEHVFESNLALSMAEVKPTFHAILTLGGQTPKDGLGGLYVDEDNGSTETLVSGDGRTWYKVVDVQAERVLHTPKINRLIPRSMQAIADGLPLSPAMFGAKGWDEATDGNAIRDAMMFMAEFVAESDLTLDLMGKRYLIDKPIRLTGSAFYRKRITNGLLRVGPSFPQDEHILDFTGLTTGSRLDRNRFDNLNFLGAVPGSGVPRAGGWIRFNATLGNDIHDCLFEYCRGRGIWDENTRAGAGNYIHNNRFYGGDQQDTFNSAIRLAGYDNKIAHNMCAEFANHIYCEKGANIITGNHVYNYNKSAILGAGITTGPMENSNETLIQGNYVDTVRVDVYYPGNTTVSGNKFLIPNISYWEGRTTAFIELVSASSTEALELKGLQITGNQFKSSYGTAESVRCRTGGVPVIVSDDVFIKDNVFLRVNKRAAQVSVTLKNLTAVTSVNIDLSQYKIPGCLSDHENALSYTAQGSGGSVTGITRNNDVYTVNFATAFTGKLTLAATMCTNGAW